MMTTTSAAIATGMKIQIRLHTSGERFQRETRVAFGAIIDEVLQYGSLRGLGSDAKQNNMAVGCQDG
ncbi:hypothetical protein PR202_ga02315 [Eleusine coracana subsp. coracana]|uniref:Uncharacterized protein n=1 Tax=Eleusine coracana subsp. coracana TaxID=191504 RepID=A0AAV5BMH8_ELECO|nr:hypothetical protein PR202_ga02315 [Eleusine coracana subsp. coracana]